MRYTERIALDYMRNDSILYYCVAIEEAAQRKKTVILDYNWDSAYGSWRNDKVYWDSCARDNI